MQGLYYKGWDVVVFRNLDERFWPFLVDKWGQERQGRFWSTGFVEVTFIKAGNIQSKFMKAILFNMKNLMQIFILLPKNKKPDYCTVKSQKMRGVSLCSILFWWSNPRGGVGKITVWPSRTSCRREKVSKQESGVI